MKTHEIVERIAQAIVQSQHMVAFTGAGISTDSGLPDYRGPNGVWTRRDAGLPPPAWGKDPDEIEPNASHFALVELERLGKLKFLISQNVDGLHVESGFPLERIAEVHGNQNLMRCLSCDSRFPQEVVGWDESRWGEGYLTQRPIAGQPRCLICKGRLISSIVNFGDPLPEKELDLAFEHSATCDLFLAVGSSLVVSPANHMPKIAADQGAPLVIINRGETPFDDVATLKVSVGIGEILPPVAARVRELIEPGRVKRRTG